MEEPQKEAREPSFSFAAWRGSHLKSGTYLTLVHILSHCCEDSDFSREDSVVPEEQRADNGSNCRDLERTYEKSSSGDKASAPDQSVGAGTVQSTEPGNTLEALNEIQRMMMTESPEDNGVSNAKMFDELERLIQDNNKGLGQENGIVTLTNSADGNWAGKTAPTKIQEENVDSQQIVMEGYTDKDPRVSNAVSPDWNVVCKFTNPNESNEDSMILVESVDLNKRPEQQPKLLEGAECIQVLKGSDASNAKVGETEGKNCGEMVSEAAVLSFDKVTTITALNKSESRTDKASSMIVDLSKGKDGLQRINMEMEKSLDKNNTVTATNRSTNFRDLEDGEICETGQTLASEDRTDSNNLLFDGADEEGMEPSSSRSETYENATHDGEVKKGQSNIDKVVCKPEIIFQGKTTNAVKGDENDCVLERARNQQKSGRLKEVISSEAASSFLVETRMENETGNHGSTAGENSKVQTRKTRAPISASRKEKRKQAKRKKRAEKNRELGVKRLKLQPVMKQKPKAYCHHFLQGRCHEGENCKFSHDTVPLTKSTPCSFFARQSCLKGDDCPFDHELSKYPCTNFVSKGWCSRGDSCMFSHKAPPKGEFTPTSNMKPELKPPQLSVKTEKQLSSGLPMEIASATSNSGGSFACKYNNKSQIGNVTKPIGLATVGINFLSFGKSLSPYSDNKKPISSPMKDGSGDVGNEAQESGLGLVRNLNEVSKRAAPCVVPQSGSMTSMDGSPPTSVVEQSQTVNSGLRPRANPSLMNHDDVSSCKQSSCSSITLQNSNELLKKMHAAAAPKGVNLFSFGKAPAVDSGSNKLVGSSSSQKCDANDTAQDSRIAPVKRQYLNPFSPSLPAPCFGQSSAIFDSGIYKGTPDSAQKALFSTFAFAEKCASFTRMNQPEGALSSAAEARKESGDGSVSGSSLNDLGKSSKILDFLSGIGGKTDQ